MKKKNIILTIYLLLPITIVSLLMVWIFYSLDKDRLMADAVPYGAGAGDTGNANAIGEWLAGRDPDAISRALDARRARRAINPSDWPGGITIKVPMSAFGENAETPMLVLVDDQSLEVLTQDFTIDDSGTISIAFIDLSQEEARGFFFYATTSEPMLRGSRVVDSDGRVLRAILFVPQIPDPDLQVSEPMVVEVRMDWLYEESP